MKKEIFKGVGTAIVTPFTGDDVNYEEFGKLVDKQIEAEVSSLIVYCRRTPIIHFIIIK